MHYWVKIVFADNQELLVKDAIRHTISEDMEVLNGQRGTPFRPVVHSHIEVKHSANGLVHQFQGPSSLPSC